MEINFMRVSIYIYILILYDRIQAIFYQIEEAKQLVGVPQKSFYGMLTTNAYSRIYSQLWSCETRLQLETHISYFTASCHTSLAQYP